MIEWTVDIEEMDYWKWGYRVARDVRLRLVMDVETINDDDHLLAVL